MDEIPVITEPTPPRKGGSLWKSLLFTFLGTTLSILLTFGTSQLVAQNRRAQERKMTALMVIGNIEQYAQRLDLVHRELAWRDSLASIYLAIPQDSIDSPKYADRLEGISLIAACPAFSYDKSVEQIFSNSIETWKNMGNFKFIDNVGKCFSAMNFIKNDYLAFVEELGSDIDEVKKTPDAFPGHTTYSKLLHSKKMRSDLRQIHRRASYYSYLADFIRYLNAINMQLMEITDEEVEQFISESEEDETIDQPVPKQTDYLTPFLSPDSLPDLETLLSRHSV